MTDKNNPAFPVVAQHNVYSTGMDLRDWFAGMALNKLQINFGEHGNISSCPDSVARYCYEVADAMLEARNAK